jgi:CheY-like chemotaxis protein
MVRLLLEQMLQIECNAVTLTLSSTSVVADAHRLEMTATASGIARDTPRDTADVRIALLAALLRQMGGTQTAEREPETVRLRIEFPVQATAAPAEARASGPVSLRHRRILIADDNPLVRELFVTHLGDLGAWCDVASDGEDALRCARRGNYDGMVLDLAMPQRDGLSVARTLRAEGHRTLRIVGVSAHASGAEREQALAAGMDDFLIKPVELAALATALADAGNASAPEIRQAEAATGLQSRLAELFRADLPQQAAAIEQAAQAGDWRDLVSRAHYLKNSAAVVRDDALYAACGELEAAAGKRDTAAVQAAWRDCISRLQPWKAQTHDKNPQGTS